MANNLRLKGVSVMGKTLTEMTADIVLAQSKITKMSPIELANTTTLSFS